MTIDKINLGSGSGGLETWINVDFDPFYALNKNFITSIILSSFLKGIGKDIDISNKKYPPNFVKVRLDKGKLPFPDNSFTFCFTSHFMEHLTIGQAHVLLKEIYRVLKKESVLRIVVPDLEIMARAYVAFLDGDEEKFKEMNLKLSPVEAINSTLGNSIVFEPFKNLPRLLQKSALNYQQKRAHKYGYDFHSLQNLLKMAGFKVVKRLDFRIGKTPDLDLLETENRRGHSLYVEAYK